MDPDDFSSSPPSVNRASQNSYIPYHYSESMLTSFKLPPTAGDDTPQLDISDIEIPKHITINTLKPIEEGCLHVKKVRVKRCC